MGVCQLNVFIRNSLKLLSIIKLIDNLFNDLLICFNLTSESVYIICSKSINIIIGKNGITKSK